MSKDVWFNPKTRDYDAFLDGEYIGSFRTMREGEMELDRIAYERLRRGRV